MVFILVGFLFGVVFGSFVKAVADRCLLEESFVGRSVCPKCKHQLGVLDLIPLLSYIFLRGKCRYCHKKISIEYFIVELVAGMLGAYFAYHFLPLIFRYDQIPDQLLVGTDILIKLFFVVVLGIMTITDLKEMFIPDRVVLPSIVISFFAILALSVTKVILLFVNLSHHPVGKFLLPPHSDYFYRHALILSEPITLGILSGLGIGMFFLSLIWLTRGKGMGGGDVKLGVLMGLVLGFPNGLLAVVLSFFSGAVVSAVLLIMGKKGFKQAIPFGPFMVLGSLIALFWGAEIIEWYLSVSF